MLLQVSCRVFFFPPQERLFCLLGEMGKTGNCLLEIKVWVQSVKCDLLKHMCVCGVNPLRCDVCACDLKVDALQSLDSYLPERLANALLKRSRKSIRNILIFISDWGKIASFQYKKNNVILIVMERQYQLPSFKPVDKKS